MEKAAACRIAAVLEELAAGPEDLAFSQAAAGGDLLFLEACRRRGVPCRILLPLPEPEFVERSILPSAGGESWQERFLAFTADLPAGAMRIMPDEIGALLPGVHPYERCNEWLLGTAVAWGIERLRFICLWDGQDGETAGGAGHMLREVRRRAAHAWWIDIRSMPSNLHETNP